MCFINTSAGYVLHNVLTNSLTTAQKTQSLFVVKSIQLLYELFHGNYIN